jgi:hypothetical protein
MDSGEDSPQVKVTPTGATVVPYLDSQVATTTTVTSREKTSVYFTIAAAAFGFVNDGCKFRCADQLT